jgi:hypothetical protein
MNTVFTMLITLLLACFVGCAIAFYGRRNSLTAYNGYNGARTRQSTLNRTLDAAVSQRYLLAQEGDSDGDADICIASTRPIGFFEDEGAIGDIIKIARGRDKTFLGIAAVAIAIGDKLYTAAGGKVTNVPVAGCFEVGIALSAVSGGEASAGGDSAIVEYEPVDFGKAHVYHVKATAAGGDATEALAITGVTATMSVVATITDNGANDDLQILEAKPGAGSVTVLFNEDPVDGAVFDVVVFPAGQTVDLGA